MKLWILLLLAGLLSFSVLAQDPTPSATNLWKFRLPDVGGVSSPALAPDGTIYQGTFNGWMLAVTPEGRLKWRFKTGREIKSSPAVAADGTIYFGSRDWKFYALTPDGKFKWSFATGAWVDASPAIAADGAIYFGSWDKFFYALNPDGSLKWKFATSNIVSASPAIGADGTIYFGSHDKTFYALAPDGKVKWTFTTGAEITASPAIGADGTIYFTSTDGNCYALKPDGTKLWQLHTGGYTSSSPVLDAGENLCLMVNRFHTAITHEGKILWQHGTEFNLDTTPAVTMAGAVYFSNPWRRLSAFDCLNGSLLWSTPTWSSPYSSPTVDGRGIVYLCDGFFLFAISPPTNAAPPAKSSWPMWRANPQHTGRVQH